MPTKPDEHYRTYVDPTWLPVVRTVRVNQLVGCFWPQKQGGLRPNLSINKGFSPFGSGFASDPCSCPNNVSIPLCSEHHLLARFALSFLLGRYCWIIRIHFMQVCITLYCRGTFPILCRHRSFYKTTQNPGETAGF